MLPSGRQKKARNSDTTLRDHGPQMQSAISTQLLCDVDGAPGPLMFDLAAIRSPQDCNG
jgi:hypothetical protein